jgi:hypothetical protein
MSRLHLKSSPQTWVTTPRVSALVPPHPQSSKSGQYLVNAYNPVTHDWSVIGQRTNSFTALFEAHRLAKLNSSLHFWLEPFIPAKNSQD